MDATFGVLPAPVGPSAPDPVILRTARLIIRRYRATDAPAIQRLADDAEVSKWMSDRFPYPYGLADAEAYLRIAAPPESGELAMFLVDPETGGEGAFVGGVKLQRLPDNFARGREVGYWLGRESWGKGLATEALAALSRWALDTYPDIIRLEGLVYATNVASARVLEKAGYTYEGTRRMAAFKRGVALDVRVYGMLRDECPTPAPGNVLPPPS